MPVNDQPWFADAPPQYLDALDALEKALKKCRQLRNKGLATDEDVERIREARGGVLSVINYRAWQGRFGGID
jgi:hypothetical protein